MNIHFKNKKNILPCTGLNHIKFFSINILNKYVFFIMTPRLFRK